MSGENFDNFNHFFTGLEKQLKELSNKKNQLNTIIKKHINSFKIIESEIYKSLFNARKVYSKNRQFCNKKIKHLKEKQTEYRKILDNLDKEKKTLQKPRYNENFLKLSNSFNNSIKLIDYNINELNKILNTQILNITEENNLIEKISRLERKKRKRIELLSVIKHKQLTELHKSNYYKTYKRIENLKNNLKEIYRLLKKWSKRRQIYHKKMLDLYRKAREFKNYKKKTEEELKEYKELSNHFHSYFLKVLDQNEKKLKRLYKSRSKQKPRQIQSPMINLIVEKKKLHKQFIREKLAIALEKQKAGKKMHISEFKLILDDSKK
ncbi:MAG: hypothetical protein ACFFAH_08595 [Promethearchaeota archaeon]